MANRISLDASHCVAPFNSIKNVSIKDTPVLSSDEHLANSAKQCNMQKFFSGITETPILDRTHLRHRNKPVLYSRTLGRALASNCRSKRPGIMSRNEESVSEAASCQISEHRTSVRKRKYRENQTTTAPITKNTDTGTNHDETNLTRSTPCKAQTMLIQTQTMPNQAFKNDVVYGRKHKNLPHE